MVDITEIENEIINLEKHDTSYATIERLAWLYTVREHLKSANTAREQTGDLIGGEFCQACANKPVQEIMTVLSEHMETIKVLFPKEYDSIMRKINEL